MAIQGGYDLTMVGIDTETTFGTDPTAGLIRWPGLVTSMPNITEDYGKSVIRGLGNGRDPGLFYRTRKELALTIESLLMDDDNGAESIFGLALGGAPDSGTGVITNADLLRSFTLETGFNDGSTEWYELFTGCVINMLSLQMSSGEEVRLTADAFVKDVTRSGAEVSRTADDLSDLAQHTTAPFTFEHATITIAGITSPLITDMTVDINNNLNRIYALNGSSTIAQSFATKRDITGSLTVVKESNALRDVFTADPTASAGKKTITITLSKNSGSEYLKLTLTDCRFLSRNFDRPGDDSAELTESFDFQAGSISVDTKQ